MKRKPDWMQTLRKAPGELAIVQAFVNSADLQVKTDQLSSPRALRDWLAGWGLLDVSAELTDEDLRRAIEVRKGLPASSKQSGSMAV